MRYEGRVNIVSQRSSGHESRVRDLSTQRDQLETKANRISLFRLITFVGAASSVVTGFKQAMPLAFFGAALLGLVFVAAVAWHARVIEEKRGVEVRIEPDGEILVRGGNVTPGYYGQTENVDRLQDGWLRTGDMGSLDESGCLTLVETL